MKKLLLITGCLLSGCSSTKPVSVPLPQNLIPLETIDTCSALKTDQMFISSVNNTLKAYNGIQYQDFDLQACEPSRYQNIRIIKLGQLTKIANQESITSYITYNSETHNTNAIVTNGKSNKVIATGDYEAFEPLLLHVKSEYPTIYFQAPDAVFNDNNVSLKTNRIKLNSSEKLKPKTGVIFSDDYDYSTPSSGGASGARTQRVSSYTRSNGTHVNSYMRSSGGGRRR